MKHVGSALERVLTEATEEAVCRAGADLLAELFQSPAAIYSIVGSDRLEVRSTTVSSRDEVDRSIPLSTRILEQTADLQQSALIDDCAKTRSSSATDANDPASGARPDGSTTGQYRSALLAPIPDWGLIVVADEAPGSFDDRDLALADLVAALLGTGLDDLGSSTRAMSADSRRIEERLEAIESVLSHDFSTPLAVARAYVTDAFETGETENLETVLLALDRIEEITGGLEEYARTGQAVTEPRPVELHEAAEASWSMVDAEAATLELDGCGTILADERGLNQLLENLFANAVDHAGQDVTVRVGTFDGGSGFFVEDDGPGIPPERRTQVFEHGYSGADAHSGFGLSIVRDIVDGHGWEICVLRGAEGGARVEISGVRLP